MSDLLTALRSSPTTRAKRAAWDKYIYVTLELVSEQGEYDVRLINTRKPFSPPPRSLTLDEWFADDWKGVK